MFKNKVFCNLIEGLAIIFTSITIILLFCWIFTEIYTSDQCQRLINILDGL